MSKGHACTNKLMLDTKYQQVFLESCMPLSLLLFKLQATEMLGYQWPNIHIAGQTEGQTRANQYAPMLPTHAK